MKTQNFSSSAIIIGNLPLVKSCLHRGCYCFGVNRESHHFGRPLQLATAWRHLEIGCYLLDCGADPQAWIDRNKKLDAIYLESETHEQLLWLKYVYRSLSGSVLRVAVLGDHGKIT